MNASQISGIGIDDGGVRALQGQDYGKKLSLSPYMISAFDGKRNLFKENAQKKEIRKKETTFYQAFINN